MNEFLDEWSSPWRALHKGQATAGINSEAKQKPVLAGNSWLARARSAAAQKVSYNRHIDEAASWFPIQREDLPMSSLDLELDGRMDDLELEWRVAHDACVIAHAEYPALAANAEANAGAIDAARERRRRAEVREARIFAKLELLEDNLLGLS